MTRLRMDTDEDGIRIGFGERRTRLWEGDRKGSIAPTRPAELWRSPCDQSDRTFITWAITKRSTSYNFQKEEKWNRNWENWYPTRAGAIRFAPSHPTACDRDCSCPLPIAIQADRVIAFPFICVHVLQLITLWSLIAPDRHRSSDGVGALESSVGAGWTRSSLLPPLRCNEKMRFRFALPYVAFSLVFL